MKMKKNWHSRFGIAVLALSVSSPVFSQYVRINTTQPKMTLDIVGSPDNVSIMYGLSAPRITADKLKLKTYSVDQSGALVYVTEPLTVTPAVTDQTKNISESGYYYFDGGFWKSWKEPLRPVVSRGNYSDNYISFIPATSSAEEIQGSREGALGINKSTNSFFFGNMSPTQTGQYNSSFGYGALRNLTTAGYNVAMGVNAGAGTSTLGYNTYNGSSSAKLLNGDFNTFLGNDTATNLTQGRQNSLVGEASMQEATSLSSYNAALGNNTLRRRSSSWGNIAIGKDSGVDTSGSNNIYIGNGAGRTGLATGVSGNNKLYIHSSVINSDGTHSNLGGSNPLVYGDFLLRTLQINGTFSVNPANMPNADLTYTKNLVAKPDSTFGWEAKAMPIPDPPTTGNYKLHSANGTLEWIAE